MVCCLTTLRSVSRTSRGGGRGSLDRGAPPVGGSCDACLGVGGCRRPTACGAPSAVVGTGPSRPAGGAAPDPTSTGGRSGRSRAHPPATRGASSAPTATATSAGGTPFAIATRRPATAPCTPAGPSPGARPAPPAGQAKDATSGAIDPPQGPRGHGRGRAAPAPPIAVAPRSTPKGERAIGTLASPTSAPSPTRGGDGTAPAAPTAPTTLARVASISSSGVPAFTPAAPPSGGPSPAPPTSATPLAVVLPATSRPGRVAATAKGGTAAATAATTTRPTRSAAATAAAPRSLSG